MTETVTKNVPAHAPSSLEITLGNRMVRARHVHESGINTFSAECSGCGDSHDVLTICFAIDKSAPPARALYLSLKPDQAREYAAMLLDVAQQLDGGRVLQ